VNGPSFVRRTPPAEVLFLSKQLIVQRVLAARRDGSSRVLYAVAGSAGALLFGMILSGSYVGARTLAEAHADALLFSIPAWAFLIYLFTDIFIAFGQALGDLYLSADMPVLLTMPLRTSSIVVAKFVSGVVQNEVYVAAFLVPFVLGYFAGTDAPLWAYPVALLGVAIFPAILYALLASLTIVALRYIPAHRAKEVLWLVGAIVPTAFWVASFSGIAKARGDIGSLRLPSPPLWLPSTWLGNLVSAAAMSRPVDALAWFCFLLFATLAFCPAALAFISRCFVHGWSESITVMPRSTKFGARTVQPASAWIALFRKDAWTFVRTPQLWFGHITALGFVAYLLVGHRVQTPLLPLTVQLAMVQIGFVAVLAGLNPGMTALSLEHAAIWILRAMPFRAADILRGKLAIAGAQTAIVISIGAAALSYGYAFNLGQTAALVVFALLMAAVSVCCGIAFDATFPSFNWENPNSINRGIRMIVPFVCGLGVLMLCAMILGAMRVLVHGLPAIVAGLALCCGVTLWIVAGCLRTSYRKIEALEV
jgi:ABC-2 type transport system permease protein